MQFGTITQKTKESIHSMCLTIKQAHKKFAACFAACLQDLVGQDWQAEFGQWNETYFAAVLMKVREEMKAICQESGMDLKTYNRYFRAASNFTFAAIPFALGTHMTTKELLAIKQNVSGVDDEQKAAATIIEAKAVQRAKNEKSAASVLKNRTILAEPSEFTSANEYASKLSEQINHYFQREDVRKWLWPIRWTIDSSGGVQCWASALDLTTI